MSGKAGYIQKKTNENSFFTATLKTQDNEEDL